MKTDYCHPENLNGTDFIHLPMRVVADAAMT
jgi:hypothetical protein